jgi:hypothetical protein
MGSPCCLCVCIFVCPPQWSFQCLNQSLRNLAYTSWQRAHLNGVFNKSLPSFYVSICVYPLSLIGNGSVNTLSWQRIHATTEEFLKFRILYGPCHTKGQSVGLSVYPLIVARQQLGKHVPEAKWIVGGIVFYAVRVVSNELILIRSYPLHKSLCSIFLRVYWFRNKCYHLSISWAGIAQSV